ncbi:hypothetical protein TWF694_006796 [Orbilia ellipsospora]|uniref:Uncharacterized protein n=1 Tax=Orbilia ellipsospora TaxID=2528407 RepID=A0AAV9XPN8_9PEZI
MSSSKTSGIDLQDAYDLEFKRKPKAPSPEPLITPSPTIERTPAKHDRIVVCEHGHLYTTTWVPLISFKAVRLGNQRYQKCPIGQHWSLTERVDERSLTPEQREEAAAHHDWHIW